jgi:hypothetical protein
LFFYYFQSPSCSYFESNDNEILNLKFDFFSIFFADERQPSRDPERAGQLDDLAAELVAGRRQRAPPDSDEKPKETLPGQLNAICDFKLLKTVVA